MSRLPWTRDELETLLPKLKQELADIEAAEPHEIRPLPPMTREECQDYFNRLMDTAAERPLTSAECFIHGQLLCNYQHAILAESFGKKGRFFVISEEEINQLVKEQHGT